MRWCRQVLLKSLGDAGKITWTNIRGGYYTINTIAAFGGSVKAENVIRGVAGTAKHGPCRRALAHGSLHRALVLGCGASRWWLIVPSSARVYVVSVVMRVCV